MATFKYLIQGKSNPTNVYIRLSLGRGKTIKRKTGYVIDPKEWSTTGFPKQNSPENKNLKSTLEQLQVQLGQKLNESNNKGQEIDGLWLEQRIDEINNKKEKTDLDRLVNYCQYFIDSLPTKVYRNGKHGASSATIKKYVTIKNKITEFEKHKKKTFFVRDVNMHFRNEFVQFLMKNQELGKSTVGKYLKVLKTVCLDARENELQTHPQLDKIMGFSEETSFPILTFEELRIIQQTKYERKALENARDWLIIGCYIGQRVSDLLNLTRENIQVMGGRKMIVLTQQKTGKYTAIPLIHDEVISIFEKRNWNFPSKISDVNFNLHIKDVCRIAEINEVIEGKKQINIAKENEPNKFRKMHGKYKKWELVSSHICRRSFATNFYIDTPTALLINITGHSTEKQFLEYIGKPAKDFSLQLAEYWDAQNKKAKKEPQMVVLPSGT